MNLLGKIIKDHIAQAGVVHDLLIMGARVATILENEDDLHPLENLSI